MFYLGAPNTITWNVQYVKSFCENKMETKQNVVIFFLVAEGTKYLHAELVEIRNRYVHHST